MLRDFNKITAFLVCLLVTLFPLSAYSSPKITPGTKCEKINKKITINKTTYTCIKSGKSLRWSKGVLAQQKLDNSYKTKPTNSSQILESNKNYPPTPKKNINPDESLNFKNPMVYDIRDGQLIRKSDSGQYFQQDSRDPTFFDQIRAKAFNELNQIGSSPSHSNIEFIYSISDSFPHFLIDYSKRELEEAAALWNSFFESKIIVNVYLVTEKDRESIKNNRWLNYNLPTIFTRFDSRLERPFVSGGGGYWKNNEMWSGNIFLATASYLNLNYINYEWPAIAKHEFVHLVQDYAFARHGRDRGQDEDLFYSIQLQNFREGSANTIAYLTAFKNLGWSNDALDWLVWQRAENTQNWKRVDTLEEVKALILATDSAKPEEAFEQSYAVGALMYEWFIGTYGIEGYKKLIQQFSVAKNFGQALESSVALRKEELYEKMSDYVFRNYQRIYQS